MRKRSVLVFVGAGLFAGLLGGGTRPALAQKPLKVTVHAITAEGAGKSVGTISFRKAKDGLTLMAKLKDLPPGEHGFHLHENPSCDPAEKNGAMGAGIAAGSHYDPDQTGTHKGPAGGGHKGDLPKLVVTKKGTFRGRFKVAGLTLEDVQGRSVMIHAAGDNYSDDPKPLGGGGARIACGVIGGSAKAAGEEAQAKEQPKPKKEAAPAEK